MIQGIGNDIIEIERIEKAINRQGQRFLDHLFTIQEQKYCLKYRHSAPRFAARFAAKEAVAKALGKGIGKEIEWTDIEILNNSQGQPIVKLSPRLIRTFGNLQILLSLSHSRHYATAVAIIAS